MKCIYLLVITIPFSLCIIIKTENNKVIGQSKSVEPRASAIQDDDKKDLQAEPSIEHSHYDYPGGYGYGHGHGYGHHPGGYGYGGGYGYHGGDLAAKALLIPLAGAALLGAAAIFAYNPLLIQLGVVAGKKKRSVDQLDGLYRAKYHEIEQLEKFIDQVPKDQVIYQEKKLVANYLMCSGLGNGNSCLERIVCHMDNPKSNSTSLDRSVLDIITNQIMKNEYVPETLKLNVRRAKSIGMKSGNCLQFYCNQIDL